MQDPKGIRQDRRKESFLDFAKNIPTNLVSWVNCLENSEFISIERNIIQKSYLKTSTIKETPIRNKIDFPCTKYQEVISERMYVCHAYRP